MRFLVAILLLCLVADPVAAKTINIKSGEHGTFTRLVLYLPEDAEWQVQQDKRTVSVLFPGRRYDAFLDRVFFKITRDRIGQVTALPSEGRINVLLNCDCVATAFEYRPRIVVLDVAPQAQSDAEKKTVNPGFAEDFWIDNILKPNSGNEVKPVEAVPERDIDDARDSAFSGFVDAIMQKATQGYLTASARTSAENNSSTRIVPHVSVGPHGSKGDGASFDVAPHVTETVAYERFNCGARLRPRQGSNGFGSEIASLQSKLIGDDGDVSRDVAEQMARSYIYFGLPHEARQILNLADETTSEKYLPTLAFLDVDNWEGGLPPKAIVSCEALTKLAAEVVDEHSSEVLVSPEEYLKQFKLLSPHLRKLIGPRLSAALRIQNRNGMADQLDGVFLKAQHRAEPLTDVLKKNKYEQVSLEIESVAADSTKNTDHVPDASSLQTSHQNVGNNERSDPSLMRTFLKEYDGALPEDTLTKLLVSLRADEGKFKSAVAEIRSSEVLSATDKEALLSNIVGNATANGGTRDFLEMAFFLQEQEIALLSEGLRSEIRARLLELGFDEKAEALVPRAGLPINRADSLDPEVL